MPNLRRRVALALNVLLAAALVASVSSLTRAQDAPPSPKPTSSAGPKPKSVEKSKAAKESKATKPAPSDDDQKTELTADQIVDKANAFLDDARVMTADFVQVGPDGERTEGQLYVARPGKLFFKYNPPSPLEIVADGRSVAIRDRKLGTQDLYFISQTPLKFLLADHIDLRRDVTIKRVAIDENAATIEIEDKQTFGGKSDVTLIFDPQSFALKQWTVVDPQGFQTVVTLFELDLVSKPDPSLFAIDTSPGVNSPPGKH
jgi:outer membrane lipoprotein-sorting protein